MTTPKKSQVTENEWERLRKDALETGREAWLAGLGAASSAKDAATAVFDHLVEKGDKYDGRVSRAVEEAYDLTTNAAQDFGGRLETFAEEKIADLLHRFGLPTRKEVKNLIHRVELLSERIETLATQV